jgi:hypothetical protein
MEDLHGCNCREILDFVLIKENMKLYIYALSSISTKHEFLRICFKEKINE